MLKLLRWRFTILLLQRDHKADDNPRQGRMYAGFQYCRPQHRANQDIDTGAPHAAEIERRQYHNRASGDGQRQYRQIVGIKQRDNHNRPEVINNSQRHQENFQRRWYPVA